MTNHSHEDLIGLDQREDILLSQKKDPTQFHTKKQELQSTAKRTLEKKNIHIGISSHVLQKIKTEAAHQGIPYQIFINHILHKYTNKELVVISTHTSSQNN